MKPYELTIIANPDVDIWGTTNAIEDKIFALDAEIEQKWYDGKKRLAYPIHDKDYGIYVSYNINMPEENANKLYKELDAIENVMRFLLVTGREK